jgi:hypothetical protein
MPQSAQQLKRFVLPFTLQCRKCQTYLHRGRKVTAKREQAQAAQGTRQRRYWRYVLRCPKCGGKFALLPRNNAEYDLESVEASSQLLVQLADPLADSAGDYEAEPSDTLETAVIDFLNETESLGSARSPYPSQGESQHHEHLNKQHRSGAHAAEIRKRPLFLDAFLGAAESIFDEEPLWISPRRRNDLETRSNS